jgi:hypothetical protein
MEGGRDDNFSLDEGKDGAFIRTIELVHQQYASGSHSQGLPYS